MAWAQSCPLLFRVAVGGKLALLLAHFITMSKQMEIGNLGFFKLVVSRKPGRILLFDNHFLVFGVHQDKGSFFFIRWNTRILNEKESGELEASLAFFFFFGAKITGWTFWEKKGPVRYKKRQKIPRSSREVWIKLDGSWASCRPTWTPSFPKSLPLEWSSLSSLHSKIEVLKKCQKKDLPRKSRPFY